MSCRSTDPRLARARAPVMLLRMRPWLCCAWACLALSCSLPRARVVALPPCERPVRLARLVPGSAGEADFEHLRADFEAARPGHTLQWHEALSQLAGGVGGRGGSCLLVQSGSAHARLGDSESELGAGDLVLVRAGETLVVEGALAGLSLSIQRELPVDLPSWIRFESDPALAQPGLRDRGHGLADERALLAWSPEEGPYLCRSINVQRASLASEGAFVHPLAGGFEELILVLEAAPGASIELWPLEPGAFEPGALEPGSVEPGSVEPAGEPVSAADDARASQRLELQAGELLLVPRGWAHQLRGAGRALWISVPGARPGSSRRVEQP